MSIKHFKIGNVNIGSDEEPQFVTLDFDGWGEPYAFQINNIIVRNPDGTPVKYKVPNQFEFIKEVAFEEMHRLRKEIEWGND